jgi:hypothetical protein
LIVGRSDGFGVRAQHLFDPSEIRLVAQVGNQDPYGAPGGIGEASRQRIEPLSIAGDKDQILPARCQPIGIGRADAGRCARYQCCAFRTSIHVVSPTLFNYLSRAHALAEM